MLVLKDVSCPNCNDFIGIVSYFDKELQKSMVSHGMCISCFKNMCLPEDEYLGFISKYCINIPA